MEARLDWLNKHPAAGPSYFAVTSAFALVTALVCRFLVEHFGLDRRGHTLGLARWVRGDAPWYYLFSGLDHPSADGIDGAIVAAVVELSEGSYIYTGVLMDYEVNAQGELDRLLLVQAQRRPLQSDRQPADNGYIDTGNRFYPIAGDVFVLRYMEIKTLNISYLALAPNSNGGP